MDWEDAAAPTGLNEKVVLKRVPATLYLETRQVVDARIIWKFVSSPKLRGLPSGIATRYILVFDRTQRIFWGTTKEVRDNVNITSSILNSVETERIRRYLPDAEVALATAFAFDPDVVAPGLLRF